jgi:hypothetical protein
VLGLRIKEGTIMLFDDYFNFPPWRRSGFKAFADFVEQKNVSYEYIAYKGGREAGTVNGAV